MRIRSQTSRFASVLVAGALTVAGCSDESGEALPSIETTPPRTEATSHAPHTGGAQLEAVNACDLVTEDDAATLSPGLAAEDLGSSAAHSVCEWSTSVDRGVPIEDGITFGIATRPAQAVDEVSVRGGAKVTDGKVGQRHAKRVAENDGIEGSCLLVIEVGSGRVDITVEARKTDRACQIASDISTIIEPKLPQE